MKNTFLIFIIGCLILGSCTITESETIENVNAEEFKSLMNSGEGILLDVRTFSEVKGGQIIDATNLDFHASDFSDQLNLMRKDVPVYVYCRSGGRSFSAAKQMNKLGFKKIYNLEGGITEWINAGYNVVKSETVKNEKKEIISIEDFTSIILNNNLVLVDFHTQWCVPCRKMKPIVEEIAREDTSVRVVFIDADINRHLVTHYELKGVPTFIVFKKSEESFRHVGMITKEELTTQLRQ